jgi:hypothetical protein
MNTLHRLATLAGTVAAAAASALLLATGPARAAEVGVSIAVSQPGVYGRVDIGRLPAPEVLVAQPVVVARPYAWRVEPEPVFLWVPPGHRKHWKHECRRYGACGTPVVFASDRRAHDHGNRGPHGQGHRHRHRHGRD